MAPIRDEIQEAGGYAAYGALLLERMKTFREETPVQEEVAAQSIGVAPGLGGLAFGTVVQCEDGDKAGRIKVQSKIFPEGPQTCDYVSPIAGAGYGLFAVPGVGAIVLVGKNPYNDSFPRYYWMGGLYGAGQREIPGMKSQPYKLGEETLLTKNEIQDDGEAPLDEAQVSYGVPNEADIYRDNNLPDSFLLKHPAGHSITLSDKNTSERQINEIKVKTAGNKKLILSDAPAAVGGNIRLIDENSNEVRITSIGETANDNNSIKTRAGGNIETMSVEGGVEHMIGSASKGHYTITNVGKGNIEISSNNGHINMVAATSFSITCGNSVLKMTPDGIDITTPVVNIIGDGDVIAGGVSLVKHVHGGVLPGPSLTTQGR